MSNRHANVIKVMAEAKAWGMTSLVVPKGHEGLNAPFSSYVGFDWKRNILYLREDRLHLAVTGNDALHEIGHFAVGCRPDDANEIEDGIFAYEFYQAKRLDLKSWSQSVNEYVILKDGGSWGDCNKRERAYAVAESLTGALARGIVDKDGNSTYKRFKV